jgi:hypothetical protein
MSKPTTQDKLQVESVVELAREVAGTQGQVEGRLIMSERLGPGVVREIISIGESNEYSEDGMVLVHWPMADLDTWIDPKDLEPANPKARLIAIYHFGSDGHRTLPQCKVIANEGLRHNWEVELFPAHVIRTIRSDGLAWTFDWHPILRRADPHGTIMEEPLAEDDHAEALTVAELSIA